jgi:Glycosyl hydrolase family 7
MCLRIMFHKADLLWFPLLAAVSAQQVGTQLAETHPNLSWQTCTTGAGCTVQSAGSIVLDANWRWTHSVKSVVSVQLVQRSSFCYLTAPLPTAILATPGIRLCVLMVLPVLTIVPWTVPTTLERMVSLPVVTH